MYNLHGQKDLELRLIYFTNMSNDRSKVIRMTTRFYWRSHNAKRSAKKRALNPRGWHHTCLRIRRNSLLLYSCLVAFLVRNKNNSPLRSITVSLISSWLIFLMSTSSCSRFAIMTTFMGPPALDLCCLPAVIATVCTPLCMLLRLPTLSTCQQHISNEIRNAPPRFLSFLQNFFSSPLKWDLMSFDLWMKRKSEKFTTLGFLRNNREHTSYQSFFWTPLYQITTRTGGGGGEGAKETRNLWGLCVYRSLPVWEKRPGKRGWKPATP